MKYRSAYGCDTIVDLATRSLCYFPLIGIRQFHNDAITVISDATATAAAAVIYIKAGAREVGSDVHVGVCVLV